MTLSFALGGHKGVGQTMKFFFKTTGKSTSRHFTFDRWWNADGYGYQWRIFDYYVSSSKQYVHSYSALGWGGQDIIVLPQLNTVVVLTGGNYNVSPPDHDIVRQYILPAVL